MGNESKRKIIIPPTERELREARERFVELLKCFAKEREFQTLFAECPYILSRTLPVKMEPCDIVPLGRPGNSEPDFVFYSNNSFAMPTAGVIELKRPDTKILVEKRKGIIQLSADAMTAMRQVSDYAKKLDRYMENIYEEIVIIGNPIQSFAIMGLKQDLLNKSLAGLCELTPSQTLIVPYDEILAKYESGIAPRVSIIVPDLSPINLSLLNLIADVEKHLLSKLIIMDIPYWQAVEKRYSSISNDFNPSPFDFSFIKEDAIETRKDLCAGVIELCKEIDEQAFYYDIKSDLHDKGNLVKRALRHIKISEYLQE